jgi:hypothetical protein
MNSARVLDQRVHVVVFAVALPEDGTKSSHTFPKTSVRQPAISWVRTPRRYFVTKTRWTCRAETTVRPDRGVNAARNIRLTEDAGDLDAP